ncbi:MAG: hypothetical protein M3463_19295 [Verrucomicrobiota bacterium]|nr:hypothetical protein [Verrucomicrobiota bacterium]
MQKKVPPGPLVLQALVALAAGAVYLLFPAPSRVVPQKRSPPPSKSVPERAHEREGRPPARASLAPVEPKPDGVRSRGAIVAQSWMVPQGEPHLTAFREWTVRYFEAPEPARSSLVAEGRHLARERLGAFSRLIESDPRLALASTVPYAVRKELPPNIADLLERRVNTVGSLIVVHNTPAENEPEMLPSVQRFALVNEELY